MYQIIEGNRWRNIWVVGDIHGCYQCLMDELKGRHFNHHEDLLISVGDLIDRGPDSVKCLQLIRQKWFYAVRGNHEQMALDALRNNDFALWTMNGGIWFSRLTNPQKLEAIALLEACRQLPHIIEINCINGRNIIAHADYPSSVYLRDKPVSAQRVLWDRARLTDCFAGKGEGISGADHFWFGHTPVDKRYDFENLHYIDTGAVFGGVLTFAQIQ
ncbi:protein-serine/threonine phosphatase [Lelliottia sp. CFBP8978]|uniref:protein-serine/threonine phosphatase n=1 Tax=Lelliottia sp. CFBP8978 TaxID=3096522 RepID=UPI002A69E2B5|nr:protein-serine/threonine phosphatase [Lelliottia sp. CFBP8978]MDY1038218.1 protein-serine/threonine phosphatase [Lelliottia sp. CFBP8978]